MKRPTTLQLLNCLFVNLTAGLGGLAAQFSTKAVTADYTVAEDVDTVTADATSAAIAVTLPDGIVFAKHGRQVNVINSGDGSYAVTVTAPTGSTINGDSTFVLYGAYQGVTLRLDRSSGTPKWLIIAERNPPLVQAVTATADGTGTGTIRSGIKQATVTCDDVNKIVVLPAPVVGTQVVIHNGATGYELRTSAPATIAINGGSGADAESAIAANSTVLAICVTTTAWKAIFLDADSDVAKVEVAA